MKDSERHWLGFVTANGERQVQPFDSHEEAMTYRERIKRHWGMPARITVAYQAESAEEAIQKIDLY